jgi:outer membrane protein assembly factor BamB
MSTHDDLELLLPALEGPASPDLAFAARLRRQFVSAAGHQPASRPEPIPPQTRSPEPTPLRPSRRRWLDLAAVAVLLLSMIGGLARVTNTATTPTPAIPAPDVAHDGQMVGRSAAGDGQIWGPAPNAEPYEQVWATGPRGWKSPSYGAIAYGSRLFRIPGAGDQQNLGELAALDLRTGAKLWTRSVDVGVVATVTTSGIIAALTTGSSDAVHLTLLDLQSGESVWTTAQTFRLVTSARMGILIVADDAVIFTANDGAYYAFDLDSGAPLWSFTLPRTTPIGMPVQVCADSSYCVERTDTLVSMVAANGTLYVSDLATATISAHSMRTGQEIWSVSTAERSGSSNVSHVALVAVNEGVVAVLQDTAASDATPVVYWGLWSVTDGHQVWKGTLVLPGAELVSNGASLYAPFKDPNQDTGICCDLAEVDVATGAVTWTQGSTIPRAPVGYLSDDETLVLRTIGSGESIEGLNIRTRTTDWTLPLSATGCSNPMFPLSPEGLLPCFSNVGQLAVYQPVRSTATPTADATEPPVTVSGSAAMDGTVPGPAPASGEYRLR